MSAVNHEGKFEMECLTQPGLVSSIEVKITSSDRYNAKGYLYKKGEGKDRDYWVQTSKNDAGQYIGMILDQYSYDGVNWNKIGDKDVEFNPGDTVYLSFAAMDSNENTSFEFNPQSCNESMIQNMEMEYNGYHYSINIDFKKNKVTGHVSGEYYH